MNKRFEPIEGRNAEIIESVMSCAEVSALSEDIRFKVRLCVEEVEENILCYSGTTWVEVSVADVDGKLIISFSDGGMEFNPLAKEDPDITAPLENRQIGGLGIFLCKQMMDEVEYRYVERRNIFVMKLKHA